MYVHMKPKDKFCKECGADMRPVPEFLQKPMVVHYADGDGIAETNEACDWVAVDPSLGGNFRKPGD